MNAQLQSGLYRGLILAAAVAIATGGETITARLLTGDTTKTAIIAGIGVACNTLLARLAESGYDAHRQSIGRVVSSDVGPKP